MADKPGFFQQLFGKKEANPAGTPGPKATFDYSVLPEMALLLTNKNEQAAADMRLLAEGTGAFARAHQEWCDEMEYTGLCASDEERQEETLNVFAYWLAGYTATDDTALNPVPFGAYIDWKEETDNILELLGEADGNLGYGLNLGEIKFNYTEFTDEALQTIARHLRAKGLTLCALDTQSDSYHLFVLREEDFGTLQGLAQRAGFRFTSAFK